MHCLLCGSGSVPYSCHPNSSQYEAAERWSVSWSSSLSRLLHLDTGIYDEVFASEKYCLICQELIYDAEFIEKTIANLNSRLMYIEASIKSLLTSHYQLIQRTGSSVANHRQHSSEGSQKQVIEEIVILLGLQTQEEETKVFQDEKVFDVSDNHSEEDSQETSTPLRLRRLAKRVESLKKERQESEPRKPRRSKRQKVSQSRLRTSEEEENQELNITNGADDQLRVKHEHDSDDSFILPDDVPSPTKKPRKPHSKKAASKRQRADKKPKGTARKPRKNERNVNLICNYDECRGKGPGFRSSSDMRAHLSTYHGGEGLNTHFHCNQCPTRTASWALLDTHVARTHGDAPTHLCTICGKFYWTVLSLKMHVEGSHSEYQMRPKCKTCLKTFDSQELTEAHEKLHLPWKPFHCVVCEVVVSNTGDLINHVKKFHEKLPFPCDVDGCEGSFASAVRLSSHKRQKHDRKKYQCPYCPYTAYSPSRIKHHLIAHTKEKPHKCDAEGCDQAFSYKYQLKRHGRKAHGILDPRICPVCSKTCNSADKLKRHEKRHSDHRPFMCEDCSRTFKSKDSLRRHQKEYCVKTPGRRGKWLVKYRTPKKAKFPPDIFGPASYADFAVGQLAQGSYVGRQPAVIKYTTM